MKTLWRISNHSDLKGIGGEKMSGRWHTAAPGKRIVYLAEHPALALIEILVNLKGNTKSLPRRYQLMKIAVSKGVSIRRLDTDKLTLEWREDLVQTQAMGDRWLARGSALLVLPSVPCPEASNILLNPLHADAQGLTIEWSRWVEYDQRLFQISLDKIAG